VPLRRVAPKAASLARFKGTSFMSAKKRASLGFEPGQPPSMKSIPKASKRLAMATLSSLVRLKSWPWVPSRRVVS
jgi:hypothetical protein